MITSAIEALDILTLEAVEFDEVGARKILIGGEPQSDTGALNLELDMQFRCEENTLSYRVRATTSAEVAEVVVVVAGHYRAEVELKISPEAITEFANKVAFMALFPYIREAVGAMFNRIGLTVVLPIMDANTISFSFDS
ncbi:hypothetical protein V5R04_02890 [Jonesiaceae bacterium BS-20]|uniref:Preprotein translocase subunit SecB n=1 Tax=Jonesiaceae bacterium BS-20 TaxID=3120821 RepID=A0AAU7DY40_9MICO